MIPPMNGRWRINSRVALLVLTGLAVRLYAGGIVVAPLNSQTQVTKTLSFPAEQRVGNLYLEPETGSQRDYKGLGLSVQWNEPILALGDVRIPENSKPRLYVCLGLSSREKGMAMRYEPWTYQVAVVDRIADDPEDLSGLSALEPNDLFWLSIATEYYRRTRADPAIFAPMRHLTGLQMLSLRSTGITKKGLEYIRPLRSLKALELTQASLKISALSVLQDLPELEYLDLDVGVTDAGLKYVGQVSNLTCLRLVNARIWGKGLAELAKLPRLERLCFHQDRVQLYDRHVKQMESLTSLKGLTFWGGGCNKLTDDSLESIAKLPVLEELYFIRTSPRFTPAGVAHLKALEKLKAVDFAWAGPGRQDPQYGDEIARELAQMPQLESVEGVPYLSAEGLKALSSLPKLKTLWISLRNRRQGYRGPTGLAYLGTINSLEKLCLMSEDPLSDEDLACLESLTNLKDLTIQGQVSDRGLASIGRLKKLEKLNMMLDNTPSQKGLKSLNGLSNLQMLQIGGGDDETQLMTTEELPLDLSGLTELRELYLSRPQFSDEDLSWLKYMPSLTILSLQSSAPLPGSWLHHLEGLPKLDLLLVNGLSSNNREELEVLSSLPKLRSLDLRGDVTDSALGSLTDLSAIRSIRVDTDHPISQQTAASLKDSNAGIEYIHINERHKSAQRVSRPQNKAGNTQ